jgi:hypothetical protein
MKTVCVSVLALAAVAGATKPAVADQILYEATLDTVSYATFSDIDFGCIAFCLATSTVRFESSTGFPALTADFGADKELRVTYSAPAGQRFVFDPPTDAQGADTLSITFLLWLGDVSVLGFDAGNATDGVSIAFSGLEGSLTQSSFRFAAGHDGGWFPGAPIDSFVASYRAEANGPWSFESVSASFTVPAIYDEVFNDFAPVVVLSATATWQWFGVDPAWAEPDVWGSVQQIPTAVPEPGMLGLAGVAVAAGSWRRRRMRQRPPSRRAA